MHDPDNPVQKTENSKFFYNCDPLTGMAWMKVSVGQTCSDTPCGLDTTNKIFARGNADQSDPHIFHDSDLDNCKQDASAPWTELEVSCFASRCGSLCFDTWGAECAAYITRYDLEDASPDSTFCFVVRRDCTAIDTNEDDDSWPIGWGLRSSDLDRYEGGNPLGRERHAATYFCYDVTRRQLQTARQLSESNALEEATAIADKCVDFMNSGEWTEDGALAHVTPAATAQRFEWGE